MISFFGTRYQCSCSAQEFGLCENSTTGMSFLNEFDKVSWIGNIENVDRTEVQFVPIENCLHLKYANGTVADGCDALLVYPDNIIFIELNCGLLGRESWITSGVAKLNDTIAIFKENHNIDDYPTRAAYLIEKTTPLINIPRFNLKNDFIITNGIQLLTDSTITI